MEGKKQKGTSSSFTSELFGSKESHSSSSSGIFGSIFSPPSPKVMFSFFYTFCFMLLFIFSFYSISWLSWWFLPYIFSSNLLISLQSNFNLKNKAKRQWAFTPYELLRCWWLNLASFWISSLNHNMFIEYRLILKQFWDFSLFFRFKC